YSRRPPDATSPGDATAGENDAPAPESGLGATNVTGEPLDLEYHPVTSERLPDLELFSACHGKFRYCSCARWRRTSAEFRRSTKDERVAALASLVRQGTPVGVLAYLNGEPVGWCSVAPRETYAAL